MPTLGEGFQRIFTASVRVIVMTLTMTPDSDDIDVLVRRFVAKGSGLDGDEVIPGNDSHPAPRGLYATVLLIDSRQIGTSITAFAVDPDNDPDYILRSLARVRRTYSVQWFRDGAVNTAERFRAWAYSPFSDTHDQQAVSFADASTVQRLDGVISSEWEERSVIDLTMMATIQLAGNMEAIREAPVEVTHNG